MQQAWGAGTGPVRRVRGRALVETRPVLAGYATRMLEQPGSGPALLFLHGYGDSADTWRETISLLRPTGAHMVAVDLPGFGEADRLHRRPILAQLDDFASAAVRRLGEQHGRPVVLVGNSMGGCTALRLAEKDHRGVGGVVAVAPAGLGMGLWYGLVERDLLLRGVVSSRVPLPAAVIRRVVGRAYRLLAFSAPGRAPADVVRDFVSHYSDRRTVARRLAVARALLPELRDAFELAHVRSPVLVVWGERDRMVYPAGAERLRSELRDVEVELLPGCGHCPQVEAPETFARMVAGFWRRIASGASPAAPAGPRASTRSTEGTQA